MFVDSLLLHDLISELTNAFQKHSKLIIALNNNFSFKQIDVIFCKFVSFIELTKTISKKTFDYFYRKFDFSSLFDKCLSMREILIHRTKTCQCSNLFFFNNNFLSICVADR